MLVAIANIIIPSVYFLLKLIPEVEALIIGENHLLEVGTSFVISVSVKVAIGAVSLFWVEKQESRWHAHSSYIFILLCC
jgi:hypothetical protein